MQKPIDLYTRENDRGGAVFVFCRACALSQAEINGERYTCHGSAHATDQCDVCGWPYGDEQPIGPEYPNLCTCGEDVAGFGIPWGIDHNHLCNCPWELAQCAEYDRLCSQPLYINVYLHDRAYGGGEEGGWWYDTYEIIQVIPVKGLADAQEIVRRLEEGEYSNEGRRDISSVISEGVYVIQLETTIGVSKPERTPHYE